jgi:hypothetical protein
MHARFTSDPPGRSPRKILERETGIEPATNSLEGCDSTTELLPPSRRPAAPPRRFGGAKPACMSSRPLRHSPLRRGSSAFEYRSRRSHHLHRRPVVGLPSRTCERSERSAKAWLAQPKLTKRAKAGGEGRIRTSEAARATDLQSAAFDRFATSPVSNAERRSPIRLPSPAFRARSAYESAICLERFGFLRRARVGRGPDIGAGEGI